MQYFKTAETGQDNAKVTVYTPVQNRQANEQYSLAKARVILPPAGATGVSRLPRIEIEKLKILSENEIYLWLISDDSEFNNIVYQVKNRDTGIDLPEELDPFTTYYVRVDLQSKPVIADAFVSSVTVTGPASVDQGSTIQMVATLDGVGDYSNAVTWSVSPQSSATINSSGVLQGVEGGQSVTVTATSVETPSESGTATVQVNAVDQPVPTGEMVVWDETTDPPPIYVPNDIYPQSGRTPNGIAPLVNDAANDLADYIAQSSGKSRPSIVRVSKDFLAFPQRCIKVGFFDPALTKREEYKIVCSNNVIEISGKDVFDRDNPDFVDVRRGNLSDYEQNWMQQAGTYNAVMSFIRDHIGVVFAYPHSSGTAVPSKTELIVANQNVVRQPSCMVRNHLRLSSPGYNHGWGTSREINKRRGSFFSMYVEIGHRMDDIFDRFHPDGNPGDQSGDYLKYFALQPDGTRSGWPDKPGVDGRIAKVETGEPDFDQFYIDNYIVPGLDYAQNGSPQVEVFGVEMNDSWNRGHSRDPRALSMDYPTRGLGSHITGTFNSITDNTKNWEVDEFVGLDVLIKEGTNIGITKQIISNTSDTLVVDSDYPLPIDNTSYYEIQEPNVITYPVQYETETITDAVITDREVAFAKRVLNTVQQNPEYSDFYISTTAYGVTIPRPRREVPDDKNIIINVSNEFSSEVNSPGVGDKTYKEYFDEWLAWFPKNQVWRPNLGKHFGHRYGFWFGHAKKIGTRFKELISNGVIGLITDTFWENHGNQWRMYYLLAELMWDHTKDIDTILDTAYQTLFGDAWTHVKLYYDEIETVSASNHNIHSYRNDQIIEVWTNSIMNSLSSHLNNALGAVPVDSDEYERLEYIKDGFDYANAYIQACRYFVAYNEPATIVNSDELATLANAIEDGSNGTIGWSNQIAAPAIQVEQDAENNNENIFRLNAVVEGNGVSKLYERTTSFPQGSTVTGTATGGDSSTLIDSSKSMVENEHINRIIRITGGLNEGQERLITANTADSIIVEPIFLNPIDNTCTYEIVDMYLVSVDIKHTGNGGSAKLQRSQDNSNGVTINPRDTERKTYKLYAYGGENLLIRDNNELDRSFDIYVYNLSIKKASPVNKQAIADVWIPHNENALNNAQKPKWGNYPPFSNSIIGSPLPSPTSGEFVPPDIGLE